MADRDHDQLRRISAALDGDGSMPDPLDADGAAFLANAERLRSRFRVEEAVAPPDVTDAVLEQVRAAPAARRRANGSTRCCWWRPPSSSWRRWSPASWSARTGRSRRSRRWPTSGTRCSRPRRTCARWTLASPCSSTVRTPTGPTAGTRGPCGTKRPSGSGCTCRRPRRSRPAGPANDIEVVIDEQTAWTTGLHGCPVGQQPACLGEPEARLVEGAAPFAPDHVAPLDLVIPAGAFLPERGGVHRRGRGGDRRRDHRGPAAAGDRRPASGRGAAGRAPDRSGAAGARPRHVHDPAPHRDRRRDAVPLDVGRHQRLHGGAWHPDPRPPRRR